MKKYGKFLKKTEVLALLLSISVTMVQPAVIYAADVADIGNVGRMEDDDANRGENVTSDSAASDVETEGNESVGEEIGKAEEGVQEPVGEGEASDVGDKEDGHLPEDVDADVVDPSVGDDAVRIDQLQFAENNKTVDQTACPKLKVTIAEDIPDEYVYACFEGNGNEKIIQMSQVENMSEQGTCYEGIFLIDQNDMEGRWNLKQIYVERDGEKLGFEIENIEKYWFQIKFTLGADTIHINDLQFLKNKETVDQTSSLKLSIRTNEIILDKLAYACFVHESGRGEKIIPMSKRSAASKTDTYYEGNCSVTLDDTEGVWKLAKIYVVRNGDEINMELDDAEEYWFEIKLLLGPDTIHVNKLQFYQNGWIVDQTIRPMMEITTAETILDKRVCARFIHENDGAEKILSMDRWSADLSEDGSSFSGFLFVDQDFREGIWKLQEIYVERGGKQMNLEFAREADYWFKVKLPPENDTEKPEIRSVALEYNGETVSAGQKVGLTVEAADNGILKQGTAWFRSLSTNEYRQIRIQYDALTEGIYKGTFEITEDMRSGEWHLFSLDIRDGAGNQADCTAFTDGASYPYYVNVSNGDGYTDPAHNISVWFYALNENGEWTIIDEVKKENVKHRATLREAGIIFPEVTVQYSDFKQTGWMDYRDVEITEDAAVLGDTNWAIYAQYDKLRVRYLYYYRSEDGRFFDADVVNETFPAGTTYGEVREKARNAASPKVCPAGLDFQEWHVAIVGGADDEILKMSYYEQYADAVYDKELAGITYSYINEAGEWCSEWHSEIVEKGTTYRTLLEKAKKYEPQNHSGKYELESWECSVDDAYLDEAFGERGDINFKAKYSGKLAVPAEWTYYDKDGYQIQENTTLVVDEGTTVEEVKDMLNQREIPQMYPELGFKEWNITLSDQVEEVIRNGQTVWMRAVYDKYLVRYIIDPGYEASEDIKLWDIEKNKKGIVSIFCQAVEMGERVTVPESFVGFEDVTWLSRGMGSDTFTATEDKTFIGYGKKTETGEEPDEPEDEKPIELPKDKIAETVDEIQKIDNQEDKTVVVEMDTATIVPMEILEAAKAKNVDIKLEMGSKESGTGYTWIINGMDIDGVSVGGINLGVKMDENAVPPQIVQELAGSNQVQQMSLEHEGAFGFDKAVLSINVGNEYAGQYGNLFYYNKNGKMEFIDVDQVAEDGEVSFGFTHASDYVVVMSDEKMSQANVPKDLQPDNKDSEGNGNTDKEDKDNIDTGSAGGDNSDKNDTGTNAADKDNADRVAQKNGSDTYSADKTDKNVDTVGHRRSAKTGDDNETMPFILYSILALGVIVSIRRKRTV